MTEPNQGKIEPGFKWKAKFKDKDKDKNMKIKDKKDKPRKQMTWNLTDYQCSQQEEEEKE